MILGLSKTWHVWENKFAISWRNMISNVYFHIPQMPITLLKEFNNYFSWHGHLDLFGSILTGLQKLIKTGEKEKTRNEGNISTLLWPID